MRSNRVSVSKVARLSVVIALLMVMQPSAGVSQVPGPEAAARHAEPSAPTDPLMILNNTFRAAYLQAKEAMLVKSGPVILSEGDNLVLRKGAQRVEVRCRPTVYHALKSFAHIPLALDVILATRAGAEILDEPVVSELRGYRKMIAAVEASIANHGLDAEQLVRQRKILDACVKFLDSVVEARKCTVADRRAFTRHMTPLVMVNVAEAVRAELDALHRQVCDWKSQMTEDEWKHLSVVIMGAQLPRKQNLALQYFARLLDVPGEGSRITYAESIHDESQALDLMATRALDTIIGVDFFNDPLRMHRDLLSDAAKDYLPLLIDRP
jgi:hypothetical protein